MCGDTRVCSKSCSEERYHDLKGIDPALTRPHTWPLIKLPTKVSLFNSEIILKSTKNSAQNINEQIFKTQNEYYDNDYDTDDISSLVVDSIKGNPTEEYHHADEAIQNICNRLCQRCFVVGVPATLCALCIIIISAQ